MAAAAAAAAAAAREEQSSAEAVTAEEDPLAQAMSMLDSLGGGDIGDDGLDDDDDDDDVFEDFAIDSDDDEEVDLNDLSTDLDVDNLNVGAAAKSDSEIGGSGNNADNNAADDDDNNAGGPARATTNFTSPSGVGAATAAAMSHPLAHPLQDVPAASAASSDNANHHAIDGGNGTNNNNANNNNDAAPPPSFATVPTSSSVSGWTSSLASFASRAAASVQTVVENAEAAVLTTQQNNAHLQQQQQQRQQQQQSGSNNNRPGGVVGVQGGLAASRPATSKSIGVMSYQERQKLLHQRYHASNNNSGLRQQQQQQQQAAPHGTPRQSPATVPSAGGTPPSSSSAPSAQSSPQKSVVAAAAPTFLDKLTSALDASAKTKLVSSALGTLLPGEKVIMFLNCLGDVKDVRFDQIFVGGEDVLAGRGLGSVLGSSSNGNGGEGAGLTTVWCCVMTFYRVAVFSYQATLDGKVLLDDDQEQEDGVTDDNGSNNSNDENEVIQQWIRSQNVSVQFQAAHCGQTYNEKRNNNITTQNKHHVFQMPLASIERVEKVMASSQQRNGTNANNASQLYSNSGGGGGGYSYNAILPSSSTASIQSTASSAMVSLGSQMKPLLVGMASGSSNSGNSNPIVANGTAMIGAPHSSTAASSSNAGNAPAGPLGIVLHSKDGGRWIKFSASSVTDARRAHDALNTYAFPGRRNLGYLFAFESRRAEVMSGGSAPSSNGNNNNNNNAAPADDGGNPIATAASPTGRRFRPLEEYERQGALRSLDGRSGPWAPILQANANYGLCSTYPSVLVGPRGVVVGEGPAADATGGAGGGATAENAVLLRRTAAFRSENRFPALTWGNPRNGGSVWRSSQPKVGLQGNRSADDERYLYAIGEEAKRANLAADARSEGGVGGGMHHRERAPVEFLRMLCGRNNEGDLIVEGSSAPSCMLKIMDMRPKSAAMGNRTQGYGYENTNNYRGSTINFYGIGNIHAVRDAYQKVNALCLSPNTSDLQWMQLVENTNWPSMIRLILSAAWQTAFHVHYNRLPVLVHCSHGWDRTSQVPALAQLFLDPHFRTRKGFSTLVEKDFLSFGHPFHTRCGHGEGKNEQGGGDEGQLSPIFLQFLDCVWQLVNQFPDYFEFNARYLLLLSEHIYSCRFGTLLCDSEREREVVAGIRQRTYCMWEYLDSIPELVNPTFDKNASEQAGAILMPLPMLMRNVTLWTDRYCMYGAKATMPCMPPSSLHSSFPPYLAQSATGQPLVLHTTRNGVDRALLARALEDAEMWKKQALNALNEMKELKMKEKQSGKEEKEEADE